MLVFADKSTNLYELSRDHHEKLLQVNITQTYQKTRYQTKKKFDREAKKFAKSLGFDEKMECYSYQSAFITLKDHKANFKNNIKCRLINRSKSEVGLVSKHYRSSIISTVVKKRGVNQWRNTTTVIKRFEYLQNKQKRRFIKFDIADFYRSITEPLLERSIEYPKLIATIEHKTLEAISLAGKSLLFSKHEIWVKKDNSLFDVTMESFHGAEICEIVGLYLLDKLSNLLGKETLGFIEMIALQQLIAAVVLYSIEQGKTSSPYSRRKY